MDNQYIQPNFLESAHLHETIEVRGTASEKSVGGLHWFVSKKEQTSSVLLVHYKYSGGEDAGSRVKEMCHPGEARRQLQ